MTKRKIQGWIAGVMSAAWGGFAAYTVWPIIENESLSVRALVVALAVVSAFALWLVWLVGSATKEDTRK